MAAISTYISDELKDRVYAAAKAKDWRVAWIVEDALEKPALIHTTGQMRWTRLRPRWATARGLARIARERNAVTNDTRNVKQTRG
jgi:predicted transcriptional regulator